MPTYDYRCEKCGNEFEEILKIADRNVPTESSCTQNIDVQQTEHMTFAQACGGEIKMKTVAPGIGDPLKMGIKKPDGRYVEKLKEIKKNHPLGTVSAKDYW